MSRASIKGRVAEVRDLFYIYSGAMTYLFIFISLCTFIFADLFVLLLAGEKYLQNDPITGFSAADIVRVFSFYGLLLPIDRMTGIALDSLNKPHINALKVFVMVAANILGDLIAIFVFKSLMLVAVSSIIFTLVGIWLGLYFLDKEHPLLYRKIFTTGIQFYTSLFRRSKNKKQSQHINAIQHYN